MKRSLALALLPLTLITSCIKTKKNSTNTAVVFDNIKDGDTVSSTFDVKFSVKGMKVVPAGQAIDDKKAGHHHILVDHPTGYIPKAEIVPADKKHIHFGKGQTETKLTLSPGKHKLSLQFADGAHRSYGKNLAHSINVTVK